MKNILELTGTIEEITRTIFGDRRPGRSLDVATGRGGMINLLRASFSEHNLIHAIDADFDVLQVAQSEMDKNITSLAQMDAAQMGFQSACFELVSIGFSLHHLEDIDSTLREIWRVTRIGGVCLVSEMYCDGLTRAQLSERNLHHFVADIDQALGKSHNHTLSRNQILDHLTRISWVDISVYSHSPMMDADAQTAFERVDKQLTQHLNRAQGLERYNEFLQQAETIRNWVRKWGMERAPVLLLRCRK